MLLEILGAVVLGAMEADENDKVRAAGEMERNKQREYETTTQKRQNRHETTMALINLAGTIISSSNDNQNNNKNC